jgi:DNA/RNA-binding domain of Phe-tRNA-synthetase-like protein
VVQGKDLYQIDTLVDLINLASMKFGYSIGGFDADKFEGDTLTLGVGRKDEPYEGIGRGILNIEGMPVYRDSRGGVGTPTSDNERTKIELSTTHLFVIVNGYDGNRETVNANALYIKDLLERFAEGKDIQIIDF